MKETLEQLGIKAPRIFYLYFVVPEDKFVEYKLQKYPIRLEEHGTMKAIGVVRQVEQCVLLLPIIEPRTGK